MTERTSGPRVLCRRCLIQESFLVEVIFPGLKRTPARGTLAVAGAQGGRETKQLLAWEFGGVSPKATAVSRLGR